MYAIIEDSGTQIKVSEGDVVRVATREMPSDAGTITFERILMLGDGADATIGTPLIEGAKVTADILEEGREEKVTVIKFKRRKGYRRKRGHRQDYLSVKVTAILQE